MSETDQAEDAVFTCPHCGEEVDVAPRDAEPFMICPHCRNEFVVTRSENPEEDEQARQEEEEKLRRKREEELDTMRIRSVSLERRALIRHRSYALVAALLCFGGLGQCIYLTVWHVRHVGWDITPVGYILLAIAACFGIVFFFRKAQALQRAANRSALTDPTAPPDFTPLSDGSQAWKNLEDVR